MDRKPTIVAADGKTVLRPGGGAGAPLASVHPDHQPFVPVAGGVPPSCSCGFVGGWRVGETLAEHIRQFDPSYSVTP